MSITAEQIGRHHIGGQAPVNTQRSRSRVEEVRREGGFEFGNRSRTDHIFALRFSADPIFKVVAHGFVRLPSAYLSVGFQILRLTRSFTTSIAIRSTALQASVIGLV